jgi:Fe-S-cluster containining protein
MSNEKDKFWKNGIQFQCQGSGKCCTSRGEFGYVYMTPDDRKRMADFLDLSVATFTRRHCEKTGPVWHLKEIKERPDCQFLKDKNRCSVYEARPTQCRTWPFWPEMMNAKAWSQEVVSYCPGVGKGRVISAAEIEKTLQEQIESEKKYGL